jgi:hypothetical protein
VQALWLNGTATEALYERTTRQINWAQTKNAIARNSHVKTKRQKLKQLRIDLRRVKRCKWPKPHT